MVCHGLFVQLILFLSFSTRFPHYFYVSSVFIWQAPRDTFCTLRGHLVARPDPTLRNRMEVWGKSFPVKHVRRIRACVFLPIFISFSFFFFFVYFCFCFFVWLRSFRCRNLEISILKLFGERKRFEENWKMTFTVIELQKGMFSWSRLRRWSQRMYTQEHRPVYSVLSKMNVFTFRTGRVARCVCFTFRSVVTEW